MRKEYHPDILCFQDQTFEVALSLSETLLCQLKRKIGRRTLEFELSERKPLERGARSACFSRHVDKRDREGGREGPREMASVQHVVRCTTYTSSRVG